MSAEQVHGLVPPEDANVSLLVCVDGSLAGSRFALAAPTSSIGRDPVNDVFLDDISVSRRHAEIERVGPAYVLRDSRSFNGTYLNGERVDEILLEDGDELRIGRFILVFFSSH